MLKAWPADRELTAADMIRDLNYAEGEPNQQVQDACRFAIDYAKDVSLAADFLSLGMDLKAGGSYESPPTCWILCKILHCRSFLMRR